MPEEQKVVETVAEKPWYAGIEDAELRGHIENRGWDKKTAAEAAIEAAKAHREAHKFIGVPPEQLLKMPKADDAEGMRALWERLGAPKDAAGYEFPDVVSEDKEEEAALRKRFAQAAHEGGLSKEAAAKMVSTIFEERAKAKAAETQKSEFTLDAEREALRINWGSSVDVNTAIAKRAAVRFGLPADVMTALEKSAGYSNTMNFLLEVGKRTGEGAFVISGGTELPFNGVNTRDGAIARNAEMMKDAAWFERFKAGGTTSKEYAEFQHVTRLIAGAEAA